MKFNAVKIFNIKEIDQKIYGIYFQHHEFMLADILG